MCLSWQEAVCIPKVHSLSLVQRHVSKAHTWLYLFWIKIFFLKVTLEIETAPLWINAST